MQITIGAAVAIAWKAEVAGIAGFAGKDDENTTNEIRKRKKLVRLEPE